MADIFQVHEVARIRTGKYAGMVGTVTETRYDPITKNMLGVKVEIEGTSEGKDVKAHRWFKRSEVARNG